MHIVLFHSAYGLRPAVHSAAARLRAAGHEVHVPDLYGGRTAETVEDGMAIRDEIGRDELLARAAASGPPRSSLLVYAGFSLGASVAQDLALADDAARGLLLLHGTADVPPAAATEIPVQLHVAEPDPFEPEDWLTTWQRELRAAGAEVDVHRYPRAGHIYTDPGLPDFDAGAAERTWAAATVFLAGLASR